ncbi:hypothetical protein [Streptomyces sp. NPDC058622]
MALDRLATLVRNRLKRLPYQPHTLDGFIAGTGLTPAWRQTAAAARRPSS